MGYMDIDGARTRVYVETGINTDKQNAKHIAAQLRSALEVGRTMQVPVGAIVNGTQGIPSDIDEFLPNDFKLRDALNDHTYRTLNNKGATLIIAHSAGNNDAVKAMELASAQGYQYGNLSFLSLGSPIAKSRIEAATTQAGVKFLGQVNDWRDPVTHSKSWVAGTAALAVGGAVAGVALAPVTGGGSLAAYFSALVAGGAGVVTGGGAGLFLIDQHHGLDKYIDKPQSQSIMFNWLKANPSPPTPLLHLPN